MITFNLILEHIKESNGRIQISLGGEHCKDKYVSVHYTLRLEEYSAHDLACYIRYLKPFCFIPLSASSCSSFLFTDSKCHFMTKHMRIAHPEQDMQIAYELR